MPGTPIIPTRSFSFWFVAPADAAPIGPLRPAMQQDRESTPTVRKGTWILDIPYTTS